MSHLGRWLSALVDGELDSAERDHVLNHLAGCRPCLLEANEMRAIKRRLTAFGDHCADSDIAERLIGLAADGEPASGPALRQLPEPRPRRRRPGRLRMPGRLSGWHLAAGAACTVLTSVGCAAFLLGTTQAGSPVPKVTPAVDAYWPQYSYDSDQEPAAGTSSQASLPAFPGGQGGPNGHQQPSLFGSPGAAWPGSDVPASLTPALVSPSVPYPAPASSPSAGAAPRRS